MKLLALFLAGVPLSLSAQAPPATPSQLSPQAAYDQATKPVEIIHRSVSNWSDVEQASLSVAVTNAKAACATRKPEDYTGDQLIAFARLCSLGLNFPAVLTAATQYIAAPDPKPQLALASYGLKIEAALHLHDRELIVSTARALLTAVPYDATADSAINEALDYLALVSPGDALDLYGLREPIVLKALQSPTPLLPLHTLYADGIAFSTLMLFDRISVAPAQELTLLDAALPTPLPPDEAIAIASTRRLYALLGKPLPVFTPHPVPLRSPRNPTPQQFFRRRHRPHPVSRLVRPVRPPRSHAQPRHDRSQRRQHSPHRPPRRPPHRIKPSFLPSHPLTPRKPSAVEPAPTLHSSAAALLHTPTLAVPPATLQQFEATDFPFLIITDHAGIVRYAAPGLRHPSRLGRRRRSPHHPHNPAMAHPIRIPALTRQPPLSFSLPPFAFSRSRISCS